MFVIFVGRKAGKAEKERKNGRKQHSSSKGKSKGKSKGNKVKMKGTKERKLNEKHDFGKQKTGTEKGADRVLLTGYATGIRGAAADEF